MPETDVAKSFGHIRLRPHRHLAAKLLLKGGGLLLIKLGCREHKMTEKAKRVFFMKFEPMKRFPIIMANFVSKAEHRFTSSVGNDTILFIGNRIQNGSPSTQKTFIQLHHFYCS